MWEMLRTTFDTHQTDDHGVVSDLVASRCHDWQCRVCICTWVLSDALGGSYAMCAVCQHPCSMWEMLRTTFDTHQTDDHGVVSDLVASRCHDWQCRVCICTWVVSDALGGSYAMCAVCQHPCSMWEMLRMTFDTNQRRAIRLGRQSRRALAEDAPGGCPIARRVRLWRKPPPRL
jgi:hypothetical protein